MRYITVSYLNWQRNGKPSKFEVWKKCSTYTDLCSKMHHFHTLSLDFELWWLAISRPLFEISLEIGRIFEMEGSWRVLVEVRLFQFRGHGHPKDDAIPNCFPDSKSSILGLSNEVSFFQDSFAKFLKIEKLKNPLYNRI